MAGRLSKKSREPERTEVVEPSEVDLSCFVLSSLINKGATINATLTTAEATN
jgi:hypothetical protein